ncbi:MAG: hypothetical protein H6737_17595 [Alphaproteobacteria bacterium]|nr:hypothetical protein [Alphaproteobacteria bacterium]
MASTVAIPLAVLLGIPLMAWNTRALIRLKERELDLRRLEVAANIRRLSHGRLPEYVDASDPDAVLAWAAADREIRALQ